uniref:MFS domain-containing protein n=1 Tax=Steinernema glaseri TaxID=37863 RepID=A0A1I7YGL4_9BILA
MISISAFIRVTHVEGMTVKNLPLELRADSLYDVQKKAPETDEKIPTEKTFDMEKELESRKSPWLSLWLSNFIQFLCGIQFSIYFTSMWPYLSGLDESATLDFLGWVVAAYSVGQTISSPILGWWNQKTLSTKHPTAFGLLASAAGNLLYALLPSFHSHIRYVMIGARFVTGFGSGNLGVLRAYCSTASTAADRNKAISMGIAGFVLGLSVGPAIQSVFAPIGKDGFHAGPVVFNMYTIPAYLMVLISLLAIVLLYIVFEENYAGILSKEDRSTDPYRVLPKFDPIAAGICIYLWFMQNSVSTNIEVMASPLTIAMYSWTDSQAVLYNGIIQSVTCLISVFIYWVLGYTRIGNFDKRKLIFFGLVMFSIYHIVNMPYPFYSGPLDYIPYNENSTIQDTSKNGGCYARYTWCSYYVRVPMWLYILSATVCFGIAFPFVATPTGTLYSEVLGPRNQGMMQGLFAFFGSVSRCISPLLSTIIFEKSGYLWPTSGQLALLLIGMFLITFFRRRLTALEIVPRLGVATRYKKGTFYRL